jgi:hypothetical protein
MRFIRNPRIVLAIGAGLALIAGLGVALSIMLRDHGSSSPPPASKGGLVVEMGSVDETPSTSGRQLRCFVKGQFVGMASLAQCAKKNGVSTRGLDVGLDANGVLAAADGAGVVVTPIAPETLTQPDAATATLPTLESKTETVETKKPTVGTCLRLTNGEYRKVADDLELKSCARTLFDGLCQKEPSAASYGRWGDQTLRLMAGKVEQSSDNKTFQGLAEQTLPGCHLP